MIIPFFAFDSVDEYLTNSDKIIKERPVQCYSCDGIRCFWGHGAYWRSVQHDGIETRIKIKRFICRICGKTVSLLFSFLVAHRKHSAKDIAAGTEEYATAETSYRRVSDALSPLDSTDRTPCPSHSTVFRWVKDTCNRANSLCFQIQKELMLRGQYLEASEPSTGGCPNAWKANAPRSTHRRIMNLRPTSFILGLLPFAKWSSLCLASAGHHARSS